jgi:hypothetical protein
MWAWRAWALVSLVFAVCACGPPTLDSSTHLRLVRSVTEMSEDLEPAQRSQLDEALDSLSGGLAITRTPADPAALLAAYAPFEGMTAAEIVVAAWERKLEVLDGQIDDLEARRRAAEPQRELLAGLELLEARLFRVDPSFLERPVIEATVENHTPVTLHLVGFQASLRRPNELSPWLVERFERVTERGLEPGERRTWRIEPADEAWQDVSEKDAADVFLLEVMRLEGEGGELIAASDYGAVDDYQLSRLLERRTELAAAPPYPLTAGTG